MLLKVEKTFELHEALLRKEEVKLVHKLWELIFNILETPFEGLGKPEPLKHDAAGHWSRRINDKHRLIYRVEEEIVVLVSCYGHYGDH